MSGRPAVSVKDKVSLAIAQAAGGHIFCCLCRAPLHPDEPRILEHIVVWTFTKTHNTKFMGWAHKACADEKTYGRKATCADGDIHKIAKAKRLSKKSQVQKPTVAETAAAIEAHKFDASKYLKLKPLRVLPSRPFPESQRKMQSRPFQKKEVLNVRPR